MSGANLAMRRWGPAVGHQRTVASDGYEVGP